jgi:hypothetical protein
VPEAARVIPLRPENQLRGTIYGASGTPGAGVSELNIEQTYPVPPVWQHEPSEANTMPGDNELFDAKIARAAAESETKIVRLEGKIETAVATLGGKLDMIGDKITADHEYNRTTRWAMAGIAIASVLAVAGLIIGMAVYGDALFSRGMNVRDVVQAVIKEQQERPVPPPPQIQQNH